MMQLIAGKIAALTLAGSIIMLILLVSKPLTKRLLSNTWQYYVLLIPTVLFLVPFYYDLPESAAITPNAPQVNFNAPNIPQNFYENFYNQFEGVAASQRKEVLTAAIVAVWVVGVFALALYRLTAYLQFYKSLSKSCVPATDKQCLQVLESCRASFKINRKIPLMMSDLTGTPMLVGIIRPIIILPNVSICPINLRLILQHELTHYKRRDLLFKLIALAVNTIHWFNPLSYLLQKQIDKYCESSCDEAIVKHLDSIQRRIYAQSILEMLHSAKSREAYLSTLYVSEKINIKERLRLIMDFNKPKKVIISIGVCLGAVLISIGMLCACSLNQPQESMDARTESMASSSSETTSAQQSESISESSEVIGSSSASLSNQGDGTSQSESEEWKYVPPELTDEEKKMMDGAKLYFPVPGGKIICGIDGYKGHTGIDFAGVPIDSKIIAALPGKVEMVSEEGAYGKHLVIDHGAGMKTLYAQCSEIKVIEGQYVEKGQLIALVGKTGKSTGPHLHFELILNGKYLDPKPYID